MKEKLLLREWLGVGLVFGTILTVLIVSSISEKRIYKILQDASSEVAKKSDHSTPSLPSPEKGARHRRATFQRENK